MTGSHPFMQWYGGALAFAVSLLGCREAAQDMVQHALYKSMSARRVPSDTAAQKVWFYKVVRHACFDWLQQEKRMDRSIVVEEFTEAFVDDETLGEREEKVVWVRRALALLSSEQREILVLREVNDLSYDDLAAVLQIERGTVMSRLHRARMALRTKLSEITEDGGLSNANP
ncbi:RNA polymerase sigma factor [Aliidiomarina sanyensis]|nr:RNA polymerase sigma factor [Aliidiomarina sanyensis]